jgi:hypothetical protein
MVVYEQGVEQGEYADRDDGHPSLVTADAEYLKRISH